MPLPRLHHLSLWLLIGIAGTAHGLEECQLNLSEPTVDFGLMSRLAQNDSAPGTPAGRAAAELDVQLPPGRRLEPVLPCPGGLR